MKLLGTLFALIFLSSAAFAFPMPKPGQVPGALQIKPFSEFGEPFDAGNYNYEGTVYLSNCSGSIIQFDHSQLDDKAMLLTNGHCLEEGFPAPGESKINLPSKRAFGVLNAKGDIIGSLVAERLEYATMTKTDLALYRLEKTYSEIYWAYQVMPLTLARNFAPVGTDIEIISGFWIRGFNCKIEKIVPFLKEGAWTTEDSIRYSKPGCEIMGGTSGSPVIATRTREVVGVNNTLNEDGEMCTENNPCEVDEQGNTWVAKGTGYAQQTSWIYSCLNINRQFDLNVTGCKLPH